MYIMHLYLEVPTEDGRPGLDVLHQQKGSSHLRPACIPNLLASSDADFLGVLRRYNFCPGRYALSENITFDLADRLEQGVTSKHLRPCWNSAAVPPVPVSMAASPAELTLCLFRRK